MNSHQLLFEQLLCEFNWGQADPENHIKDIANFPVEIEVLKTSGDLEKHIAKYHNWLNAVIQTQAQKNQELLNNPSVLQYRAAATAAIQQRMLKEEPDHTLMVLYGIDCKALQQDRICMFPPAMNTKSSSFVLFL